MQWRGWEEKESNQQEISNSNWLDQLQEQEKVNSHFLVKFTLLNELIASVYMSIMHINRNLYGRQHNSKRCRWFYKSQRTDIWKNLINIIWGSKPFTNVSRNCTGYLAQDQAIYLSTCASFLCNNFGSELVILLLLSTRQEYEQTI